MGSWDQVLFAFHSKLSVRQTTRRDNKQRWGTNVENKNDNNKSDKRMTKTKDEPTKNPERKKKKHDQQVRRLFTKMVYSKVDTL